MAGQRPFNISTQFMVTTIQDSASTAMAETTSLDERATRRRARRRAALCPGAGWALLGYPKRGLAALIGVAACLAALVWLILAVNTTSLWTAALATLVAAVVWSAELLDIGWCIVRPTSDSVLVRRYKTVTLMVWLTGLILPLLMAGRFAGEFGSIKIGDDRMAPAIEPGEWLIYRRQVTDSDLTVRAVVLYRLPPRAKGGTPGELVIARILAAPGDELATRGGNYVVNGRLSRFRAKALAEKIPLTIPAYPKTLTVSEDRYFMVQDSRETGIDSQQLDWARREDLVSTRLFRFSGRGLPRPVE
jgi:signal peptidase I